MHIQKYILTIILCTQTTFVLTGEADKKEQEKLDKQLMQAVVDNNLYGEVFASCSDIKALIDAKANINTQESEYKKTPLHRALFNLNEKLGKPSLQTVQLLLEHKADTNIRDINGDAPLHLAAVLPNGTQFIKALLEAKAIIDPQNSKGHTPLYRAIEVRNRAVADYLAEAGASVTLKDNKGENVISQLFNALSICDLVHTMLPAKA